MGEKLKIVTCNVNGWGDEAKRRKMFRYFHEKEFDVMCIQESHSSHNTEKRWKMEWGGRMIFVHGTSATKGVCIMFKRKLKVKVHFIDKDDKGRVLILDVTINDERYTIANVYGPNEDNPAFYRELFVKIERLENVQKILLGDFNMALNLEYDIDQQSPIPLNNRKHKKAAELLLSFLQEHSLIDVWRLANPNKFRFTWRSGQRKSRIDYIFVSSFLTQLIEKTDVMPRYLSDHSMPLIVLAQHTQQRGRGYWKFNNALLGDKKFVDRMNEVILEELDNYEFDSHKEKWDYMKMVFRGVCIEFSARKAKEANERLQNCEKKLKYFEEGLDENESFDQEEFNEVLREFHEINADRTRAAMIRTKSEWLLHGNKPSSYFLGLEKTNYNRKVIKRLRLQDNSLIEDPAQILEAERTYFQNLYTSHFDQEMIDTTYLEELNLSRLKPHDAEVLESPITIDEIKEAVKSLKRNKTPGLDGLSAEFYQFFWVKLGPFLLALYREIIEDDFMNDTSTEGIISLLEKPQKDGLRLPNWRPLTLLTVDYKILAKIISNRVAPTLRYLIHPQQSGFVKGRYIAENILDLTTAVEHCLVNSIPALALTFDMAKAFDRLEYPALWAIMNAMGFGPKFLSMVRVLYKAATRRIMNNGVFSVPFHLERSTSQGCPWSPFAFVLAIEPLGVAIRQNKRIRGITVSGEEKKAAQYADDLWAIILAEEQSLNQLLSEIEKYCSFTGLQVNFNKSEVLRLGPLRDTDFHIQTNYPLTWRSDSIKVLGIIITPHSTNTSTVNYKEILSKIKTRLALWTDRTLSLIGKIQICNSLITSLAVYKMMALPSPEVDFFQEAKAAILNFIWEGKPAKIKYQKLIQNYENTGLKLCDLRIKNDSLKTVWIKKILDPQVCTWWKKVALSKLPASDPWLWEANIHPRHVSSYVLSKVWADIWSAWANYNYQTIAQVNTQRGILDQVIWLNSNIVDSKGNPYLSPGLAQARCVYLRDIFLEEEGRFLTFDQFRDRFGITLSFLEYNALVKSIPKRWREILRGPVMHELPPMRGVQAVVELPKISNKVYWSIVGDQKYSDYRRNNWFIDIPETLLTKELWTKLHVHINKITPCTKLRLFQYKLLNGYLLTNVRRNKMDNSVSPMCSFCNNNQETIKHLFWDCSRVRKFWHTLYRWSVYILRVRIPQEYMDICLNKATGPDKVLIDTITLFAKQFIYAQKCLGNNLNFQRFISNIVYYQTLEKTIAYRTDSLVKFNRKWQRFINAKL